MNAIKEITEHANEIKAGNAKIQPGQPATIPVAASYGDEAWQGDLGFIVAKGIPPTYNKVKLPTAQDMQLVPGNTQGAKHCLTSLEGLELYRHSDWGQNYEGLEGPAIKAITATTVEHPTHGNVTIPAGMIVVCRYQREYDAELKRERRNAD